MAITFALCMLPFWLLESVWLIRKRPAEQKMLTGGLMGSGKEWKLLCTFMQTDLMQSWQLKVMYQAWWKQHVWQVPELLLLQMTSIPILADVHWTSSQLSCLENFPMCPTRPPPLILKTKSLSSSAVNCLSASNAVFCPIKWLWGNNWGLPHKKISLLLPTLKSAGELCMQKLNDLVNKNAMTAIKKCKHLMLGWGPRLLAGRSTQCENEGSL